MLTVDQLERLITIEQEKGGDWSQKAAQKIYDLCKPDHELHVAAAGLENEITGTLMNMTIATVLATLIEEEGGGRSNVQISPMSMEHMQQHYEMEVTSEGMVRTVRIKLREDSDLQDSSKWREPSNRHGLVDVIPAPDAMTIDDLKPQAEPKEYNRPEWVVALANEDGPTFLRAHDRADAGRMYRSLKKDIVAHIENRWCLHTECPSNGCNHDASLRDPSEPTSEVDTPIS